MVNPNNDAYFTDIGSSKMVNIHPGNMTQEVEN